jgi:hypothetical protein
VDARLSADLNQTNMETRLAHVFNPFVAGAERAAEWESLSHILLHSNNRFLSCRPLSAMADRSHKLLPVRVRPSNVFLSLQTIAATASKVQYLRPMDLNFPAVDAFMCCDDMPAGLQCWGFQMTVSDKHPISYEGIRRLQAFFGEDHLVLWFVVPPDVYNSFTQQPFQDEKKNRIADVHTNAVQQWAVTWHRGKRAFVPRRLSWVCCTV